MVILWAGYSFAKDYNKARGHFYAAGWCKTNPCVLRTNRRKLRPNANGVLSCKSPDVARVIEERGEDGYFEGKWARLGSEIVNPIGCADCHDTSPKAEGFKNGEPAPKDHSSLCWTCVRCDWEELEEQGRRIKVSLCVCLTSREYYFTGPQQKKEVPWDKVDTCRTDGREWIRRHWF